MMRRGRCLDCGDEWEEDDVIRTCPECHSEAVMDIPLQEGTE